MRLSVIDAYTGAGYHDRPNEDSLGFAANFAFVCDGATGLGDPLIPGQSDAAWLAHQAVQLLPQRSASFGADLKGLTRSAMETVAERFARLRLRTPAERYELPFASLSAAWFDGAALHVGAFGDCTVLVRPDGGPTMRIGHAVAEDDAGTRAEVKFFEKMRAKATTAAAMREQAMPRLCEFRNKVNTGGWHYLFGTEAFAADHLRMTAIPVTGPSTVLIVSDGFFALVDQYGTHSPARLVDAAGEGLAPLYARLRAIEEDDPECQRFARFKKSDDATALLARIG